MAWESSLSPPVSSARFAIQWSLISLGTNLLRPRSALPTEERAARLQIGNAIHTAFNRLWMWTAFIAANYFGGYVIGYTATAYILGIGSFIPLAVALTSLIAVGYSFTIHDERKIMRWYIGIGMKWYT